MNWLLLPDLLCLLVCAIGAVTDLREYRIPNWLTGSGVLLGLIVNYAVIAAYLGPAAGFRLGLGHAALGAAVLFAVFGLFGLLRLVGLGDVKLMAAVGALLRWPLALWALVYVVLAGGLLALVVAALRGRLKATFSGLFRRGTRAVERDEEGFPAAAHRLPYGVAILLGAGWAVAARYVPALRIP